MAKELTTDMLVVSHENVSESALAMVRAKFNPSGQSEVDEIKLLAARLITLMEPMKAGRRGDARCAAVAITNIEQAAMWAVKAATGP